MHKEDVNCYGWQISVQRLGKLISRSILSERALGTSTAGHSNFWVVIVNNWKDKMKPFALLVAFAGFGAAQVMNSSDNQSNQVGVNASAERVQRASTADLVLNCPDPAVDQTSSINELIARLVFGSGGVIRVLGNCLIAGDVLIPSKTPGGALYPVQPYIRITGQGSTFNGYWGNGASAPSSFLGSPVSPSTLILRNDLSTGATVAKIDTRSAGLLEIDHITLADTGADTAPFIQTTNTTISVHDVAFLGWDGRNCATDVCNDAIILGGTLDATYGSTANAAFQGYGSRIRDNYYDHIRQGVTFRNDASQVELEYNVFSFYSGSPTSGAIVFDTGGESSGGGHKGPVGVHIGNTLIEAGHYVYGIDIKSPAGVARLEYNSCWDPGATFLGCIHIAKGVGTGLIVAGVNSTKAYVIDDNPSQSNTVLSSSPDYPSAFSQNVMFLNQVIIPAQKAETGRRYVCIDTNGALVSSAIPCNGS
jgi:hypothetical protein